MKLIGVWLIGLGVAGFVLGTGPLVVVAVVDPTSTAVGPGLLMLVTFWPSVACLGLGLWLRALGRRKNGEPGPRSRDERLGAG